MKIFKSIACIGLGATMAISSCKKDLTIDKINFDVSTSKTSYKVGEEVVFNFTGDPENITLFSGEPGFKYEFRNRLKAQGTPQFQFTSYAQFGVQTNTLQVLASTTFSGVVDANINLADWTDITNAATLSTGSDNTASGVIDLTPFVGDKPVYIAYRYTGQAGSTQKTWTIKNFTVQNKLNDGPILTVATTASAGFRQVSLKNPAAVWTIAADNIKIAGGNASALENEDWVVSKALYLDTVNPDVGVALKNTTTKMTSYGYVFTNAGTYKVTFLASNATPDEFDSVVRELTITVTP